MRRLPAFGIGDAGTFPVHLDGLALDAQLIFVEQHVASPKGENLPQAGVRPEGQRGECSQLDGHGSDQRVDLVEAEQRPLGGVPVPHP